MTQRENLLRVLNGEQPEWVPIGEKSGCYGIPSFLGGWFEGREKGTDVIDPFGVRYTVGDPGMFPMPTQGVKKVPDITKWREYLEGAFPVLSEVDWEAAAAKDTAKWDRQNKVTKVLTAGNGSGSTFAFAVQLMGHEDAMVAMALEPEAWCDLLDTITTWHEGFIEYVARYYKPDIIEFADDCACSTGTFMSPAMYRELIKPYHKRLIDKIVSVGCIPEMHCCGKAETLVGDWVEMGLRIWTPAQVFNDLKAIKEKYGNKLVIRGAWESNGPAAVKGAGEEVVRGAVRRSIEQLGPGGGYIFSCCGMSEESFVGPEHMAFIYDEAEKAGHEINRK
jgi:uroporphyrinogen-III decarboxylase